MLQLRPGADPATQPLDSFVRDVRAPVLLTLGREMLQYQPDTAADFQDPPWFQCTQALYRTLQPFLHLPLRNGAAVITAVPTNEAWSRSGCRIGLLVHGLPVVHHLGACFIRTP